MSDIKEIEILNAPVQLLTVKQFSHQYNVGKTRTYEFIDQGTLIGTKVGSNIRIAREDAEAWRLSLPKTNMEKL